MTDAAVTSKVADTDAATAESAPLTIEKTTTEPATTEAVTVANRTGSPWWSSVRAVATLAIVAAIAAVTFGVLWASDDSADRLVALQARLDTETTAETAASQYALRVSEVDFRDLDAWREALTDGVSEQLAPKLDAAVDVVGPWLGEMEYTATARLLAADVAENDGDRFVVQVFVDMTSKSKQTPDGVAATATYTVTMDRASNWTITDVGGVGAGLPGGR